MTQPLERTVREEMLAGVHRFDCAAKTLAGVQPIALLGSIVTDKSDSKDVDLLVTVSDAMDLVPLATCARRLQGRLQGLNHWADVFLADERGGYLGRTCTWRECRPGIRASCDALHCGRRPRLHADLGDVRLFPEAVAAPPVELWPQVVRRCPVPLEVEGLLAALALNGRIDR